MKIIKKVREVDSSKALGRFATALEKILQQLEQSNGPLICERSIYCPWSNYWFSINTWFSWTSFRSTKSSPRCWKIFCSHHEVLDHSLSVIK